MTKVVSRGAGGAALAMMASTVAIGVVLAVPGGAHAQQEAVDVAQATAERKFDIPAQSLSSALTAFSTQADIQISAHGNLVRGVDTAGVVGTMAAGAALTRLLAGTGLTYSLTSDGAVIQGAATGGGNSSATVMGPILVQGAAATPADQANSIDVTFSDLERRNPTNVKEVFAGESAVSVGGAIAASQKVYVNGIEENNLAVTIDGARQNNKIFHHNGTNLIDPSLLKQVRVDPGVAPADAGPAALGGSIVYETVDVADVLEPDRDLGGFVTGSYDTNGRTWTTSGSGYGRVGPLELLGFVKYAEGDDYKDGNGERIGGTGADVLSFLGKGGFEFGDGHRVEVSGESVRDKADRPYRANIKNITNRSDPVVRKYDLQRQNYVFNYTMPKADGYLDPTLGLGYSVTDLSLLDPFGSIGRTSSLSGKLQNEFNISAANSVTTGVDFYHDIARYEDPSDQLEESATNVGVYAQARLRPIDPLSVSFGLRGDQQWFEGLEGSNFESSGISGNASVAYTFAEIITLKAGYSNVWGGVALAENFIFNPAWSYTSGVEPVRSNNYIAGIEANYRGFNVYGEAFRSRFDNARIPTYGGGPSLTKDFRTKGYGFGAGYNWLTGFLRFSFTDTEIEVDGSPGSSFTSQYLGAPLGKLIKVEASQSIHPIGVRVGATIDAALKSNDAVDGGGQSNGSYKVFSTYAEYVPSFADYLTLRLEANNLFNENYADRGTYGQEFATVEPLPEPGRSFLLWARAKF